MNLKLLAKTGLVILILLSQGCTWFDEEVIVEGQIREVILGDGSAGRGCCTKITFVERPDIVVYQRWESLKPYEGRKIKLILLRWKFGAGSQGLTNYYQDLRGFVLEPNQT